MGATQIYVSWTSRYPWTERKNGNCRILDTHTQTVGSTTASACDNICRNNRQKTYGSLPTIFPRSPDKKRLSKSRVVRPLGPLSEYLCSASSCDMLICARRRIYIVCCVAQLLCFSLPCYSCQRATGIYFEGTSKTHHSVQVILSCKRGNVDELNCLDF